MKFLLLVFFFCDLTFLYCLKLNDKGVCTVKISTPKTRLKNYFIAINKKCGNKKCTIKKTKIEKYTSITDRPVCCTGWEYKAERDICEPQCRTGCRRGLCIAPDQCQCTPPLELDPIGKNSCVEQKCAQQCINSYCNDNICICFKDFVQFNETHCAPKCEGDLRLNAITLRCEFNCGEGFELKEGNCKPICSPNCVNSDCVASNTCFCHEGYKVTEDNWKCRAKCENCEHGVCVAPGICECVEGYVKVNNTCVVNCDHLVEGSCHGDEDYEVSTTVCYKSAKPCDQGRCSNEHFTKSCAGITTRRSPKKNGNGTKIKQTLICCTNYEYVLEEDVCKPKCALGCEGGTCVEPNVCRCEAPLMLNADKNKCIQPQCEPECVNAVCQNTNVCTCNPEYKPYNSTFCIKNCPTGFEINKETLDFCQPRCSRQCVNGFCVAPELCSCISGYEINKRDPYTCLPICNPKCLNADCVLPNTCSCHDGYEDVEGTCKPKCEFCDDGECVGPNKCKCKDGYERKTNTCVPQCKIPCVNGFCSRPDTCLCDPGFNHHETEQSVCVPVCNKKCINSTCEAPDFCVCLNGFVVSEDRSICKPKCDNCFNGTCIEPNVCVCDKGYEMEDAICRPICNNTCLNGYCSGPDVCSCNYGFKLENDSCIPEELIHCKSCQGKCSEGSCFCLDSKPCYLEPEIPAEVQSPKMAGMEITWTVGGLVCLLLLILIIVATERLWRKKRKEESKDGEDKHQYGSVIYTAPNTLMRNKEFNDDSLEDEEKNDFIDNLNKHLENEVNQETRSPLLNNKIYIE